MQKRKKLKRLVEVLDNQNINTENAKDISDDFGANEWLVEELYEKYKSNPNEVDSSWWPVLERYAQQSQKKNDKFKEVKSQSEVQNTEIKTNINETNKTSGVIPRTVNTSINPAPIPAEAPISNNNQPAKDEELQDKVTPLKGMAKTLASNMEQSLEIPTATSVRSIPAKLLIDNRVVINNHMSRTRGGKVSFTHLIGWAIIRSLADFPSQNVYYDEINGKPCLVQASQINLGIAIDVPKPDGTRSLLVPNIKNAGNMNFMEYHTAYEELVKRARNNKLNAGDFSGTTVSLTNPGGIGTVHSVPRLMPKQGCIVGAGSLDYPAEFQGASAKALNDLGISKVLTLTSTYDHRVIQGAGSGLFLKLIHERLIGEHNFYEEIFSAIRIPYKPIQWAIDKTVSAAEEIGKTARVQELINSFRSRGHLMADIDPLAYTQRTHEDLELENHGLTFWDLDREFVTGGIGNKSVMRLREILGVLRDSYCRKVGIEYMHIQDLEQRKWWRERIEVPYQKPSHDKQLRILAKLNQAEAFETFLQTKYVGQQRFSLEGGESTIALLDEILLGAAKEELDCVAIGMAHRGRLNVLSNIAGKTYSQIFEEFEGKSATNASRTGDVKYHLGTEGTFVDPEGRKVPVYLAANPSHLEAVNGVLEGIVRAKQDRKPIGTFTTLPILIHGDAAMAGQGVVYETLQMSQLRGYRTGGTIHVIVNNQVGFTTLPRDSRTTVYASDVAKAVQAPIFHVNGDDPESVVHVAALAFEYRQKFNKDVVIDLICYRRRGHNEGDDPSMTQPLMYNLIEAKRSVRQLYTESLVGRGDITEEEYQQAKLGFQAELERAFAESVSNEIAYSPVTLDTTEIEIIPAQKNTNETSVSAEIIAKIGDAYGNKPEGFTIHPKLQQLINKRVEMSRKGDIDWAFGEIIALGAHLLDGKPVRFAGQDARRGTFVQRHAVFHDRSNGNEWLPLMNLSENQGRFWIYDSLLSEYAALAYEYGYSVENPSALVIWEAQFGDFANGAQTIIDEFISSAEQKWGQESSVVLLLPHGYEGQGPDHSSARIERYLQLCAQSNMTVARPSTPASYFHLLRKHASAKSRRPLIVFTPKAMLRLRGATSSISDFTSGNFKPVINDANILNKQKVAKVLITSGKTYYDLNNERVAKGYDNTAIIRLEQFYPAPIAEIRDVLEEYPNAEIYWVQDEPKNQGAWPFISQRISRNVTEKPIKVISRSASASPSTGSAKRHNEEQQAIINSAFEI